MIQRKDSTLVTLTDGKVIEYHPSFKFPDQIFAEFEQSDKKKLFDERLAYKRQRTNRHQQQNYIPIQISATGQYPNGQLVPFYLPPYPQGS